jgi:cytochrome c-type biogenesis protein CcmH
LKRAHAIMLILGLMTHMAWAVQPDEMLSDPALEARARTLSRELRCLVCQNLSIDDSDAPLARDLRIILRERLSAGDSDAQAIEFLTSRYGEFVLLKPRFTWSTALLWLAPFILLVAGIGWLALIARRPRMRELGPTPLTADEERRIKEIFNR